MKPILYVGLTDIINNIGFLKGKKQNTNYYNHIKQRGTIKESSNIRKAQRIVCSALLTYYNYLLTGEWEEFKIRYYENGKTINDLPVFKDVNVEILYDLGEL